MSQRGCAAIAAGTEEIDLSSLNSVDSAAVAVLLAWQRQAQNKTVHCTLLAAPASLVSPHQFVRHARLFELRGTREAC